MRVRLAVAGAIVALGLGIGSLSATAQNAAPTVTVNASTAATTLDNPGPLAAGPTTFNIVRAGNYTTAVYVVLLVPGISLDEILATLASEDGKDESSALGQVSIQGSISIPKTAPSGTLTVNLKPGLTYYIVTENEDSSGKGPYPRSVVAVSTTGDANGAVAPPADASITAQGLRFHGASTLPRSGSLKFTNNDGVAHHAIAFPLRKGTTRAQFGKALLNEKALGKILRGEPAELHNVLSGGRVSDTSQYKLPSGGTYGLVCFIDQHFLLGMTKIVKVK